MRYRVIVWFFLATGFVSSMATAQTNPLWHEEKTKNYLPHMTWPEVRELLTRTDVALIPVPALEQHGPQTPIGTDYFTGVEQSKLIAQRTDVLVVPVLLAGQSPYHMGFPGTITLSTDTMQRVYFETAQSLIHHGFRRLLLDDSHAGNQYVTRYVVDRINQETQAVAVDLNDAVAAMRNSAQAARPMYREGRPVAPCHSLGLMLSCEWPKAGRAEDLRQDFRASGESNYGREPLEEVERARQEGIRIYYIGVALAPGAAQDIAQAVPVTGGKFFDTRSPRHLMDVLSEINTTEKGRFYTTQLTREQPAYFIFVLLAFAALALRMILNGIPHFVDLS